MKRPNTHIPIQISDISNVSVGIVWTINGKEYTKYAAGSLTDNGGSISFNKSGDYTLEAAVTDEKGRKFKYEKSISVYEVSRIELALSTNEAYTDEKVTIIADTENTGDISCIYPRIAKSRII